MPAKIDKILVQQHTTKQRIGELGLSIALFSYLFSNLFQLLPASRGDISEFRQLLLLIARNNVNMQVKNILPRRTPVLLDDGDAVGFDGVLDDNGSLLYDCVDVGDEVVGGVVDGFVMLLRDDERVTFVEGSDVEENQHFVVFVHDAGGSLMLHYLAENARCRVHGTTPWEESCAGSLIV
jgi:hypothetical protein